MGTKKSVHKTGEIERVIPEGLGSVLDCCFRIRTGLNGIENRIELNFPGIAAKTAVSHDNLQQAFYDYCRNLSEAYNRTGIENSSVLSVTGEFIVHYARLIPNFIQYLSEFGEVGISSQVWRIGESDRVGIFLRGNSNGPKLIGFLDIHQNPETLEYFGYVPVETHNPEPLHHISHPPDITGVKLDYMRLFCEERDGELFRIDGYLDRGIKFP